MMAKNYTTIKVFDCTDMPKDVHDAFFNINDDVGNDCYVDYYIQSEVFDPNDDWYNKETHDQILLLDKWLVENGADEPPPIEDDEGEHVLIKHWW